MGETVFAVRALRNGAPEIPRDFLVGGRGRGGTDASETKVGAIGWGDRRILCTHLQAVADPENGNTKLEDVTVDVGGIMVIN